MKPMNTYMNRIWMPFLENWAPPYIATLSHRGYYITSIVEGSYAVLKKWIQRSRNGSDWPFSFICWMEVPLLLINKKLSNNSLSRTVINRYDDLPLFSKTSRKVSPHSIDLLVTELAKMDSGECDCEIQFTHGLPCLHVLQ